MKKQFKKEGFEGQKSYVMPLATLKKAMRHPLCKDLYITDIGYYPNAMFHSRERKTGSPQNVLIYCVKGAGWYQVNDERFELYANQLTILPQNISHKYGADKENPWTIYWIHFEGEHSKALIKHLRKDDSCKPLHVPLNEERSLLFDKLILLLEMADNMDNMLDAFLSLPYYLISFKALTFKQAGSRDDNNPVARSIAFMRTMLSAALNLNTLAAHVSLSVSHYSTLFQQKTHNSPVKYFIFLKMQHACQLLASTHLSVKQIAIKLGYEDPFHFSRMFTKVIGISPRAFRQR